MIGVIALIFSLACENNSDLLYKQCFQKRNQVNGPFTCCKKLFKTSVESQCCK